MHAASSVLSSHRMLEVEHLVIHQVFDGEARSISAIEDPAYHDGVVRGVVVAQKPLRCVLAPGQLRPAQQSMEEADVDGLKNFVEIVMLALCCRDALASARLPDALALADDGFARRKSPVAVGTRRINGLAVKLGDEDVGDGPQHWLRRALENVGEIHLDAAFAQADGGVEAGEMVEANIERRHRRARTQQAILLLKPVDDLGVHWFEPKAFLYC